VDQVRRDVDEVTLPDQSPNDSPHPAPAGP
jgi:hypothetical protein